MQGNTNRFHSSTSRQQQPSTQTSTRRKAFHKQRTTPHCVPIPTTPFLNERRNRILFVGAGSASGTPPWKNRGSCCAGRASCITRLFMYRKLLPLSPWTGAFSRMTSLSSWNARAGILRKPVLKCSARQAMMLKLPVEETKINV